jgi:hypothetical protein
LELRELRRAREVYSINRRGKHQYLDERLTDEFLRRINAYFKSKVDVPRIRNGKEQEIETLIGGRGFTSG